MAAGEAMPTVKVVDPHKPEDYLIMAEADYDPAKHILWDERDKGKKKSAVDEKEPAHKK